MSLSVSKPRNFTVHNIPWETIHDDGTRSATLVGTREPGVMFTYAFFIPAGFFDAPHSHIADSHLHVAHGELHLGYGTSPARDKATVYPTGSFLWVPAGAVHFDGAIEDTIIIGTALGPWSTDYTTQTAS
ncbi:MAG: cupin domain-containing protein [Microbacteriaceae bacterium]